MSAWDVAPPARVRASTNVAEGGTEILARTSDRARDVYVDQGDHLDDRIRIEGPTVLLQEPADVGRLHPDYRDRPQKGQKELAVGVHGALTRDLDQFCSRRCVEGDGHLVSRLDARARHRWEVYVLRN